MNKSNRNWRPFQRRAIVLLVIAILYAGAYIVLEYGGLQTHREASSFVMPIRNTYKSPLEKPTGIAFDGENLWISSANEGAIYKIEPSTGVILSSLETNLKSPWGMAWDGSLLWVTDFDTMRIYGVDTITSKIVSSIATPDGTPTGLTWDGDLVLADFEAHKIFHLDPMSGAIIGEFTVPSPGYNPSGLAWDGENLWVADMSASYIFMLDPINGDVLAYYYSPGYYPSDLAWDNGYLWVLDYSTSTVYKTEPGERAVETINVKAPSWLSLAFILTVTPIFMSMLAALKQETPILGAKYEERDFTTLRTALHVAAILASIYTGYELLRLVYNVAFLDKIVFKGDNPLWIYKFEMLLCLYALVYWVTYFLYKGVQYIGYIRKG
jgi:hypothetical protein